MPNSRLMKTTNRSLSGLISTYDTKTLQRLLQRIRPRRKSTKIHPKQEKHHRRQGKGRNSVYKIGCPRESKVYSNPYNPFRRFFSDGVKQATSPAIDPFHQKIGELEISDKTIQVLAGNNDVLASLKKSQQCQIFVGQNPQGNIFPDITIIADVIKSLIPF